MARYNKNIGSFLQWLVDERKGKPLESVTIAHVREWRELLQDEGRAGKTVNNYVKDVSASFRAAVREGLTNFNPCGALEAVSTEDSLDRQPFLMSEVISLMSSAPTAEWRGLILIAAFTGLRLGDAAKLQWKSIDLENSLITLVPSKTKRKKREVRIPIQPDLENFLVECNKSKEPDALCVLKELSTKHINGKLGLSVRFTQIMESAGVDRGKASRGPNDPEKGKGRNVFERGFHSLRHTFTTFLRVAGVAEEDRMALTGHTTRESHAIYSHTDAAALKKAIKKLPKLVIG